MPKSKRDRTVTLSKVKKKVGRERKEGIVQTIRDFAGNFERIFVFTYHNLRNDAMNEIRRELRDCKIQLAKRSLMSVALGRNATEAIGKNSHKLSPYLSANSGLLYTNREPLELIKFLKSYKAPAFARGGEIASKTITLSEGPLLQFPFSMEPQLRKMGLQTKMNKGDIELLSDYRVCTAGQPITNEQAKVLKLLDEKLSTFEIRPLCYWNRTDGKFRKMKGAACSKSNETTDADVTLRSETGDLPMDV